MLQCENQDKSLNYSNKTNSAVTLASNPPIGQEPIRRSAAATRLNPRAICVFQVQNQKIRSYFVRSNVRNQWFIWCIITAAILLPLYTCFMAQSENVLESIPLRDCRILWAYSGAVLSSCLEWINLSTVAAASFLEANTSKWLHSVTLCSS